MIDPDAPKTTLHGWLILDKPVGLGSTQAVSAVKRCLREAGHGKAKVGHGGTLDPLASGVLPVAVGEATKLAGRMLDSDKVYEFTIGFGAQTDTLDLEGAVIATSDVRPTRAQVETVLPRFTGPIEQAPPAYSAILIDGVRAYDRARAGEDVEMKLRAVTIHELVVTGVDVAGDEAGDEADHGAADSAPILRHSREGGNPAPDVAGAPDLVPEGRELDSRLRGNDEERLGKDDDVNGSADEADANSHAPLDAVTLLAHVSKGTYIRSLARDVALALGTVGHVTHLRRIKAGPFTLDQAISLDILNDAAKSRAIAQHMLPLTAGLDDIPALSVTPDQAMALRQGRTLEGDPRTQGLMLATLGDVPVALVEAFEAGIRVVRGFNL